MSFRLKLPVVIAATILLNQSSQVLISQKCLHGNRTLIALITQQSPKEESSDAGGFRVNRGRGLGLGLGVGERRESFRGWSARRRLEVEQARRRNQRVRSRFSRACGERRTTRQRGEHDQNTSKKKSAKILGEDDGIIPPFEGSKARSSVGPRAFTSALIRQ